MPLRVVPAGSFGGLLEESDSCSISEVICIAGDALEEAVVDAGAFAATGVLAEDCFGAGRFFGGGIGSVLEDVARGEAPSVACCPNPTTS
jgi:hypothetical protein